MSDTADSVIGALGKIVGYVNKYQELSSYVKTKSLADVTSLTRVEPLTIISKDCLTLDYLIDINQSVLSLFVAYYLQAVAILGKINSIEVIRILDRLNPNRDASGFLAMESIKNLSLESYKYNLPTFTSISLEDEASDSKGGFTPAINEVTNLCIGKLVNVEIGYLDKEHQITGKTTIIDTNDNGVDKTHSSTRTDVRPTNIKTTIPIAFRLLVSVLQDKSIVRLLANKSEDRSVVERYHAWRSGRISFIKDLIFCEDLIKEHKKAIISDTTSTIDEILRRVNNAKRYGLLTQNPSLVSASNIFIITETEARELEVSLGGRLSNPKIREKAFDGTYAMILVVIDRAYERVTFYINGIAASSNLSVKEIKNASKGKGPDIGDILKSLSLGIPPTF